MKPIRYIFSIIFTTIVVAILASCSDSSDEPPITPEPPVEEGTTRTVLVYMEGKNNLAGYARADIQEMKEGAKQGLNGGRLLVYRSLSGGTAPELIEILEDGSEQVLKSYAAGTSALTIAQMRAVVEESRAQAPAKDYALIFWNHGTGWISDDNTIVESQALGRSGSDQLIQPLWYGAEQPGDKHMKITSIAKALEGLRFSFIYFDCCHMGAVEVAYELRKSTDWFIASATELGVSGMPYDKNLSCFFASTPDLSGAMFNTFNFYDKIFNDSQAVDRYGCSISQISSAGLEQLGRQVKTILSSTQYPEDYEKVPYYRTVIMPTGLFDLYDYIHARTSDAAQLTAFDTAFKSVVSRHLTTPRVYTLDASKFHGLSMHILGPDDDPSYLGYDELAWYNDFIKPTLR